MKYTFLLLVFISCSDKSDLREKQLSIKDSIGGIKKVIRQEEYYLEGRVEDSLLQVRKGDVTRTDSIADDQISESKTTGRIEELTKRLNYFETIYDSLEIEINKK